jgi:SAM-dependent methyltransferase
MASAYCRSRRSFFCRGCASEVGTVSSSFFGWKYYFTYRSPWSGSWEPALDRLEHEDRHPLLKERADIAGAIASEVFQQRKDGKDQWRVADHVVDSRSLWEANADVWALQLGTDGDETRRHYSDDSLFRMLGDVRGRDVVDLGCGNGYLTHKMARSGARVTGIDQSLGMLESARRARGDREPAVDFIHASMEDMSLVPSTSFDVAVSNYVLHDVANYEAAVREVHRILRPGGKFVVVLTHPCFSCGPRTWERVASDSPRPEESYAYGVDRYFSHDSYLMKWDGFEPVPYFHRPIRDYWAAFRSAGFVVQDFDEPSLSAVGLTELEPWQVDQANRIAIACLFQLTKA